tara:strand:+ start:1565 stop:1801 length:237 start_codon:yes stop_codon:yes gene_type:complete
MRNPKSTVELSIPLLLRILEFAKDDAASDEELLKVANNIIELSKFAGELGMIDFEAIMGGEEQLAERKQMMVRAGIIK